MITAYIVRKGSTRWAMSVFKDSDAMWDEHASHKSEKTARDTARAFSINDPKTPISVMSPDGLLVAIYINGVPLEAPVTPY